MVSECILLKLEFILPNFKDLFLRMPELPGAMKLRNVFTVGLFKAGLGECVFGSSLIPKLGGVPFQVNSSHFNAFESVRERQNQILDFSW